jgi:CheY-specific phosphatase CheX
LLILSFSAAAAEALGHRILAAVNAQPTADLIQDSVNEVGNVIAGQAKALLAATPYHFTFSPPSTDPAKVHRSSRNGASVVIAFDSDIGNLSLQLDR